MKQLELERFIAIIAAPKQVQQLSASDWEMLLWVLDTARLEAWLNAQLEPIGLKDSLPATVQTRLDSAMIYAERQQKQVRYECEIISSLL